MGYLHIENLYKNQTVLLFKNLYALEKIHGTSANISYYDPGTYPCVKAKLFSGEQQNQFECLFDVDELSQQLAEYGNITIYGEFYGGKIQGQSSRYGVESKFVVFDVKVNNTWLAVPNAYDATMKLGLEFVDFTFIDAFIGNINWQRDLPSVQAARNGMGVQQREGIVLRPVVEMTDNRGNRVIAKHKNEVFSEVKTPRGLGQYLDIADAVKLAEEWVTENRLNNVVSKLDVAHGMSFTPVVVSAMLEDVLREGEGEVEDTKANRKAISTRTVFLWKQAVNKFQEESLHEQS